MGGLYSRIKGKHSKVEVLQELEKEIEQYQENLTKMERQRRSIVNSVIYFAIFIYVVGICAAYLFYSSSAVWAEYLLLGLPALGWPLLIWGFLRALQGFYRHRLKKNDQRLEDLKKKKTKILNEVKETETYKKATEILEKYDPDYQKAKKEEKFQAEMREFELRRRAMAANGKQATPAIRAPPSGPRLELTPAAPPRLVRPILARERGVVDKLLDYLVGDGPSNRFALVCTACHAHNGMALQEEFEFIAFRCCYCMTFNPSRKQRPHAPKLPALPAIESPGDSEDDTIQDSSESSSATSQQPQPVVESPPSPTPSMDDPPEHNGRGAIITECDDSTSSS